MPVYASGFNHFVQTSMWLPNAITNRSCFVFAWCQILLHVWGVHGNMTLVTCELDPAVTHVTQRDGNLGKVQEAEKKYTPADPEQLFHIHCSVCVHACDYTSSRWQFLIHVNWEQHESQATFFTRHTALIFCHDICTWDKKRETR